MGGCGSDSEYVTLEALLYNFIEKNPRIERNMILVPRKLVSLRYFTVQLIFSTIRFKSGSAILIVSLLSDCLIFFAPYQ